MVLFDGVCNLCNGSVNFIIDRDPTGHFRFAPLQSDAAKPFLERCELSSDFLDGVVLYENGRCFTRSTAALRILRKLGGGWGLLYGLIIIPRPARDALYGWIIRHRYQWFGKRASCRLPTPDIEHRFLRPQHGDGQAVDADKRLPT